MQRQNHNLNTLPKSRQIKLKTFQEEAVDFLFEATTREDAAPQIIMSSPTGSGKTIILLSYIEKFLRYNKDFIFCWFCPGAGDLELQSLEKMQKFYPHLRTGTLSDILVEGFISDTSYFINWETVNSKKNIALKESERKNLADRVEEAYKKGKKFIFIIDEEHRNKTDKTDKIFAMFNPTYEIRVSATVTTTNKSASYYEISETAVINEGLITNFMYINKDMDEVMDKEEVFSFDNEADILIEQADKVRKEILAAYQEIKEDVRPLVLIQFPNQSTDLIKHVEKKLANMGYSYDNQRVAAWFATTKGSKVQTLEKINVSDSPETDITNLNAPQDFLLFKQAIATGWDCPRAKILVKLRENMSETFTTQTLGRLRRMPKAHHYGNDILDCSYLFTFDQDFKNQVIKEKVGFEVQKVELKEEASKITVIKEVQDPNAGFTDEEAIYKGIYRFFEDKYELGRSPNENKRKLSEGGYLLLDDIIQKEFNYGKVSTLGEVSDKEKLNSSIIRTKVSTSVHGLDYMQALGSIHKAISLPYERANAIMRNLFMHNTFVSSRYQICKLNTSHYYAFIINNAEKLKEDLSLFSEANQAQLAKGFELIDTADFKIPQEETYRCIPDSIPNSVLESSVYKNYNQTMLRDYFRSTSEILFENYCEKSSKVKFVYKNGDKGSKYYSLSYTTNMGATYQFYVDYIVQLEDGSIFLIETKGGERRGQSKNVDIQAKNKFYALKDFIARLSSDYYHNFAFVRDRDGILLYNNTYYTDELNSKDWRPLEELF